MFLSLTHFFRLGLLLVGLVLGLNLQAQYSPTTVPNPKQQGSGYVSNPDDIINAAEVARLNRTLASMEDSIGVQVAVVIVESIGTANPKDFAHELFNLWGIGQAGRDNGLLIFTVLDQRRTEFETGYGLEGVLPDVVCYRIGMQELVPAFREGRYGPGLLRTVEVIRLTLEDPAAAEELTANPQVKVSPYVDDRLLSPLQWTMLIYGLLALLVSSLIFGRVRNVLQLPGELYDKYLGLQKLHLGFLLFLIPLPYIFIYLFIRRRLKKLRYQPRFSRENGAPMYLLSEEEEDAYLKAGQITEEEIGSVDYDVWKTEDENDILVLRYAKRFSRYQACPKCSYKTYHQTSSKVVRQATYSSTGSRKVVHQCKNCHYQKVNYQVIPQLTRSSGSSSGGGFGGGGGSSWGGGSSGGGGGGVSW